MRFERTESSRKYSIEDQSTSKHLTILASDSGKDQAFP